MYKIKIIEEECCCDHMHLLVKIPLNISVSEFTEYLKGKSSLRGPYRTAPPVYTGGAYYIPNTVWQILA